jgi:uncharacterized protein YwgA
MDKRQITLCLVLAELGFEPSMDSFENRLCLQKLVYLVQKAGVNLGYHHGWYLRGPYCSDLATDGFAIRDAGGVNATEGWKLDSAFSERVAKLKGLTASAPGFSEAEYATHLELVASVHFLIDQKRVDYCDTTKIRDVLASYNKKYTEEEINGAVTKLQEQGLIHA